MSEPPETLVARELAQVRHVTCASTGFVQAVGLPENLEDLRRMPLITSPAVGRELRLAAYRDNIRQEVTLKPTLASENFECLREAILSGLGVGLVPSYVVQEDVNEGRMVTALNAWRLRILGTQLFLLRMPGRDQPQAVRTIIDFVIGKVALGSR